MTQLSNQELLNQLGLTKKEVVDLVTIIISELSLIDLEYLLMNIELEIQYREDSKSLEDNDND